MEKVKNILLSFLAAFLIVMPFGNATVSAKEKVKVYIFEAGGCPYCEAEVEYLEGLSSYGEKFEIVRKQLYVDHVSWQPGADYEIGTKTAELFKEHGFKGARTDGTPFVVISDLYAEASYSTELESIIDEAYEKGDKDVVACLSNNGTNCMGEKTTDGSEIVATVIVIVSILALVVLVVTTRIQVSDEKDDAYLLNESKENNVEENDSEEENEVEIVEVKKTKTKKTTQEEPKKTKSKTTNKSKKNKK